MEFSNYCVFCKADLGSQNPRQLCYKTYCPFEDEYFEIYNSKSKEFKEKLSKPFIEENLGMFREKGCTTVDRVIQECDSYDEAINKFEHNKFSGEVPDEYVKNLVFEFYSKVDNELNEYLKTINLSEGLVNPI
jgi:hypothetical protein